MKTSDKVKTILVSLLVGFFLGNAVFFGVKGPTGMAILDYQKKNLVEECTEKVTFVEKECQSQVEVEKKECEEKVRDVEIIKEECDTELKKTDENYRSCFSSVTNCESSKEQCVIEFNQCNQEKDDCIEKMNKLITNSNANVNILATACNEKIEAANLGQEQTYLNIADFIIKEG